MIMRRSKKYENIVSKIYYMKKARVTFKDGISLEQLTQRIR